MRCPRAPAHNEHRGPLSLGGQSSLRPLGQGLCHRPPAGLRREYWRSAHTPATKPKTSWAPRDEPVVHGPFSPLSPMSSLSFEGAPAEPYDFDGPPALAPVDDAAPDPAPAAAAGSNGRPSARLRVSAYDAHVVPAVMPADPPPTGAAEGGAEEGGEGQPSPKKAKYAHRPGRKKAKKIKRQQQKRQRKPAPRNSVNKSRKAPKRKRTA